MTDVVHVDSGQMMSVESVLEQVRMIQELAEKVMKPDIHYGQIPGCGDKLNLLVPGAEKICLTMNVYPDYQVTPQYDQTGHAMFIAKCDLRKKSDGEVVQTAYGACSTHENKWGKFNKQKKAYEWPNPYEKYNTCVKMACNRAYKQASRALVAASDMFFVDLEDIPAEDLKKKPEPVVDKKVRDFRDTVSPDSPAYGTAADDDFPTEDQIELIGKISGSHYMSDALRDTVKGTVEEQSFTKQDATAMIKKLEARVSVCRKVDVRLKAFDPNFKDEDTLRRIWTVLCAWGGKELKELVAMKNEAFGKTLDSVEAQIEDKEIEREQ